MSGTGFYPKKHTLYSQTLAPQCYVLHVLASILLTPFQQRDDLKIYSLLSLNQARVILFFYPSYYVFLAMELKLHFIFPVQEILQDPPHSRQGFKRQIRGKYAHKWASHPSNS